MHSWLIFDSQCWQEANLKKKKKKAPVEIWKVLPEISLNISGNIQKTVARKCKKCKKKIKKRLKSILSAGAVVTGSR